MNETKNDGPCGRCGCDRATHPTAHLGAGDCPAWRPVTTPIAICAACGHDEHVGKKCLRDADVGRSCTCWSAAKSPNTPEPASVPNGGTPISELVLADIRERDAMGARKYGTRLQSFNGRRPLVDAYQEALDLVFYLRQALEEERAPR